MPSFAERLQTCIERGDLTMSDAARWFDRPFATVRLWVELDRTPVGPAGRIAEADLQRLEWAIRNDKGFPIPAELSHRRRIDYLLERRDGARRHARVPADRAAARG
jgi:hypothetical protein